jgi:hypothetical protein
LKNVQTRLLGFLENKYQKNKRDMRKFFKAPAVIIIIIVVGAGAMALYISQRSIPKYAVQKIDIKVESTPARAVQGRKLASMLCRSCHDNSKTNEFTGRRLTEAPQFGEI